LHYEIWELKKFEHIECEWPLFFTYLYLEALFHDDDKRAEHYREKIMNNCVQWRDGYPMLPEVYWVEGHNIDNEKRKPQSQHRRPNDNVPLIWAQSLFLIGEMIHDGIMDLDDIDPLQRRLKLLDGPDYCEYVQVVVCAENRSVAEKLEARMGDGFVVTYPSEARERHNIHFRRHADLERLFQGVGECHELGMSGRPKRPIGSLTTSRVYRLPSIASEIGKLCVFTCWTLDILDRDFYLNYDPHLYTRSVRNTLKYITENWRVQDTGNALPVVLLYFTADMLANTELLRLMSAFDRPDEVASPDALPLGRARPASVTHIKRAPREELTFDVTSPQHKKDGGETKLTAPTSPQHRGQQPHPSAADLPEVPAHSKAFVRVRLLSIDDLVSMKHTETVNVGYVRKEFHFHGPGIEDTPEMPMYYIPSCPTESQTCPWQRQNTKTKLDMLPEVSPLEEQLDVLQQVVKAQGLDSTNTGFSGQTGSPTVRKLVYEVLERAGRGDNWRVARKAAALLNLKFDRLSWAVSCLLVENGITVLLHDCNDPNSRNDTIWVVMTPELGNSHRVADMILERCEGNWQECILVQELLYHVARLARKTDLITNVHRLEINLLLRLLVKEAENMPSPVVKAAVGMLPPTLGGKVGEPIMSVDKAPARRTWSLRGMKSDALEATVLFGLQPYEVQQALTELLSKDKTGDFFVAAWTEQTGPELTFDPKFGILRELNGVISRVPADFYRNVWHLVADMKIEPKCGSRKVSHEAVLSMTEGELNFELTVEHFISGIKKPEFRQMVVELLQWLHKTYAGQFSKRNHHAELEVDKLVVKCKEQVVKDAIAEDAEFYEFKSDKEEWDTFYSIHPNTLVDIYHKCIPKLD